MFLLSSLLLPSLNASSSQSVPQVWCSKQPYYQVWKLLFIVVIFNQFMALILFHFDCRSEPPYEETLIVPPRRYPSLFFPLHSPYSSSSPSLRYESGS
ncbi:hypothetical protein Hanom_Chr00s172118g01829221 [Helianthus anomalus]